MALIETVSGSVSRDAAAPIQAGRPSARTLEILHTLVGFDTVSRNSNLGLIEWVRDELARLGVTSRLSWDADRRKANLFATLGEGRAPGIVLSGHTDVVPVDGQDWHSDPFKVTERDGKLFGRGTADMKGYIASALAAAPAILQANLPSAVHFAFSYDEEVGCFGVHELIKDLQEAGIQPAGCIVGEPTSAVWPGSSIMAHLTRRVQAWSSASSPGPMASIRSARAAHSSCSRANSESRTW